jgi:hypothetical protein
MNLIWRLFNDCAELTYYINKEKISRESIQNIFVGNVCVELLYWEKI